MADFRVRAVWDIGNAAQFEQQAKATVNSSRTAIQSASGAAASPTTEVGNILSQSENTIRRFLNNVKPAFESFRNGIADPVINRSLQDTGNLLDQSIARMRILTDETVAAKKAFTSADSDPVIVGLKKEQQAQQEIIAGLRLRQSIEQQFGQGSVQRAQEAVRANTVTLVGGEAQAQFGAGLTPLGNNQFAPTSLVAQAEAQQRMYSTMTQVQKEALGEEQAILDQQVAAEKAQRANLERIYEGKVSDLQVSTNEYLAVQERANAQIASLVPAPVLQTNPELVRALQTSPAALSALRTRGFGVGPNGETPTPGTAQFAQILQQQGVETVSLTKDSEAGVTKLGVSFKNLDQNARLSASGLQTANVAIRDNGQLLVANSQALNNSGKAARGAAQEYTGLGRVIQRTIEYATVAGLAYAGFNAVLGSLGNINKLNTDLTRLSVTAGLSGAQTRQVFDALTKVAYETATPLEELVSAADDIALAVKQAGQSTQSYIQDITSLTQAVGIFTNLSGVDTVTATDQLTSSFKQLALAPGDLIGILDKVTAVAGGQSNAIKDIVASLGSVAGAAKSAGLSVDEMIASIQVLGQVTNKSPDELAVAFKALFGSLISPGSVKTLQAYGIAVKDAEGNIRPFLDVYRQISDYIAKGIIPQGQIETVERAIAGGPRRLPDAAAFLDNIGKVSAGVNLSLGATNEALTANAKIVDTNTAKFTQLQVALDASVYKEFSQVVSQLVSALLDLGLAAAEAFKFIGPVAPQLISFIGTVGLLYTAFKILSGIGSVVKNSFLQVSEGAAVATTALEAETIAAAESGRATGSLGAIGGRITGRTVAGGLIGGVAGGAASAVTGGGPGDILGSILTGVGGGLSLTGSPEIGIPLLIAGQLLPNLIGQKKEDTTATLENTQATLQQISAYKSAQETLKGLATDQNTVGSSIDQLLAKGKLNASQTTTLANLQDDYANNVIASINATNDLNNAFGDITTSSAYADFIKTQVAAATNDQTLNDLKQKLAEQIIKATNPDFAPGGRFAGQTDFSSQQLQFRTPAQLPVPVNLSRYSGRDANGNLIGDIPSGPGLAQQFGGAANGAIPFGSLILAAAGVLGQRAAPGFGTLINGTPSGQFAPTQGVVNPNIPTLAGNAGIFSQGRQFLPITGPLTGTNLESGQAIDFNKIASGAEDVRDIFTADGKAIAASFTLSNASIDAVNAGLAKLAKDNPAIAQTFQDTWNKAANAADTYSYVLNTVAVNLANIQAQQELGIIGPDEAKQLAGIQNAYALAAQTARNIPNRSQILGINTAAINQYDITQSATRLAAAPTDPTAQKEFADQILKNTAALNGQGSVYDQVKAKGAGALNLVESKLLNMLGITNQLAKSTTTYKETLDSLTGVIDKEERATLNSAAADKAQRDAALATRISQGDFNGKGGAARLAAITAEYAAADAAEQKFTKAINDNEKAIIAQGGTLQDARKYLRGVEDQFRTIPGFADAATLSSQQFIDRIISQGIALGLTGKQMETLTDTVLKLIAAEALIPNKIVTDYQINVNVGAGVGAIGQSSVTGAGAGVGAGVATPDTSKPGGVGSSGSLPSASGYKGSVQYYIDQLTALLSGNAPGSLNAKGGGGGSKAAKQTPTPGLLDLDADILKSEQLGFTQQPADIATIIANARKLQAVIPGQKARDKDQIVEILDGTKRLAEVRGISEELLRKSMDELAAIEKKRLDFDTKADTIRRIRIGSGDFAAIANVPYNKQNNVSVGGPNGPINININGQLLTPAQFKTLADQIGAYIKSGIANS